MANFHLLPSTLQGTLTVPSSKSHTLRAILFAALAHGSSSIEHFLPSPDSQAMIDALTLLGAKVAISGDALEVEGLGGKLNVAEDVIQCGNSGQVLRFIGALAGLMPHYTLLTGDHSIRHQRPIKPLLEGLSQLGAFAISSREDGYAPIVVKGPLTREKATIEGTDSQPVSALLIAAAFAPHPIELEILHPGEKPWIDLTLHWFDRLGISYQRRGYDWYRLEGNSRLSAFHYQVPGDFSTAAFPIVAALLTHSELTLSNIDMDDIQGDKAIIPVLEKMGAHFIIDKKNGTLTVKRSPPLQGMRIDINDFIDALPILAVVGCFAQGVTEIVNGAIARTKESDRIHSIAQELQKMGAQIEELPDGLRIHTSSLHGAEVRSYHDHRMALSLSIAALAAKGETTLLDVDCVKKTYPTFYQDFRNLGASISQ